MTIEGDPKRLQAILWLPPAGPDEILPRLERYAALATRLG